MYIARTLEKNLGEKLSESKIVVLRGPRGCGKLTLLSHIFRDTGFTTIDCSQKKEKKSVDSVEHFAERVGGSRIILIREAQLLESLQDITDYVLNADSIENCVLCCSFEPALNEELWEALRYQGLELHLTPFSYAEMAEMNGLAQEEKNLDQRLIFGYYPEVVADPGLASETLVDLINTNIISQLGAGDRINKISKLNHLLRLIAFNIGEAVSYNEMAQQCELDNETVERYVQLLVKADLLYELPSFSSGQRYELKKSHVIYFTDNGIRNAVIRQFQPLEFRNDINALWKNWLIAERKKANAYGGRKPVTHFWKTHTKQEMDYMESTETGEFAYKMQWNKKQKVKIPASFSENYPATKAAVINRSTFWNLLTKK